MERTSFSISKNDLERVNSRLEYGDNRSGWIRDAVKMKLVILSELEEQEEMRDEERREFIREAVREKLERQD